MGTELPSGATHLPTLQKFKLPFGKYKDKTFDETPLDYLDWLVGQNWLKPNFKEALGAYLTHPTIAKELEKELNKK